MNYVNSEDKLRCPRSQEILSPSCQKQTLFIHGLLNARALFVKYGDSMRPRYRALLSPLSLLLMSPVFDEIQYLPEKNLEKTVLSPLYTATYSRIVFWG